ncbi:MAG: substrate-binding domain-containing protein, partial [Clostridia bacterium]|nr:substrate-binding domain-containing protein [Clostridia bacterium]
PFDENAQIVKLDSDFKITENMPVLDGATALLPVYSAVINAVYPEDSVIHDGNDFTSDSAMQYKNTLRGYKAIVDGDTDILFCAGPSKEQAEYAAQNGVELEYVPIGREAFVFLVNSQNPVQDLSIEEIRGIYAGRYKNWKDVGGTNRVINPLTRLEGSGSQTALVNFLGNETIGNKSPLAFLGGTLGFSFRYYVEGIVGNSGVKMISVNGVYPDVENIKNGSYPIVSEFYAIYRKDNTNENIKPLIEWLLSDEGQYIIEESGYVGIK